MSPSLSDILSAGTCLIGTPSGSEPNLNSILGARLEKYYAILGESAPDSHVSLQDATAQAALHVVARVQDIIGVEEEVNAAQSPAIGTRDLAQLRTLLSIVFKWGVDPLLARITMSWPNKAATGPKVIDLTALPQDFGSLSIITNQLICLIFPEGLHGRIPQTLITTTLLNRHLSDILRPSFVVGWLPKSLLSESMSPSDMIRQMAMRLLGILPPSQVITVLGTVLSSDVASIPHVTKSCSSLLSRQLLRPDGVRGLTDAVFGEQESADVTLEKLEHVARVLSTVPAGTTAEVYFNSIVTQIVSMLDVESPPVHKRAAAFTLSRLLSNLEYPHLTLVKAVFLPLIHDSLLGVTPSNITLKPHVALATLTTLLTHTDPSPLFLSTVLTPIVPALYAIFELLNGIKTSDPNFKESIRGSLLTWGKIVEIEGGLKSLWNVIEGQGGNWEVSMDGEIKQAEGSPNQGGLSLLTPEDLQRQAESAELDVDLNLLGLRPEPVLFVRFIKSLDRSDLASETFVCCLESYSESRSSPDVDPRRTLLYLQLTIQMQNQLTESGSSSILKKPDHILSFVKHVLEPKDHPQDNHEPQEIRTKLSETRLSEDRALDSDDSDDEEPTDLDGEMIDTAINLLLSILEAHNDLSARTAPILNDIFSLLEPMAGDPSHASKSLAREARLVITARLASTSSTQSRTCAKTQIEENAQETYQKALKLLQDPILPVRAHGLLLLRQLVTPKSGQPCGGVDAALVPAILAIFLQTIQDDESYLFLNAVQGLSAMVDMFGKEVLRGLVKIYADGVQPTMSQLEVDKRLRIGEAFGQVIRRCGHALGNYVDILVPALSGVLRSHTIPTTLRTSALSLLGDCVKTFSLALSHYLDELSEAIIDLLQIESPQSRPSGIDESRLEEDPTSTDSKLPPLRRAAVHFMSLLMRARLEMVYKEGAGISEPPVQLKRARTTLSYIASTDPDTVVRVMAREAVEEIDQLGRALIGI